MIEAQFQVTQVDKPNSERLYNDLEELLEDFPLDWEEINLLYEGKDLEKWWAKRKWLISLLEPEEE